MYEDAKISLSSWLRLAGSLKLDVSFVEYSLFCGALLQKRPIIMSSVMYEDEVSRSRPSFMPCSHLTRLIHIRDMTYTLNTHITTISDA